MSQRPGPPGPVPQPAEMSFWDHLNELRKVVFAVLLSLAFATAVSFFFAEQILEFLIAPYGGRLQTLSPTEGLQTYFRVALFAGAILSMPLILYQVWRFISPGLERQERRYVYLFIPSGTILFLLGVAFAWLVLLPAAVSFLSGFLPSVFNPEWTGREYLSFTTTFLFWLGVSFEMPLIIYFLARVGLVSAQALREQWRVAIVAIAVIAAVVTPSVDPITMLLTMIPLTILYFLSILLARVGQRQFERQTA